jgi:hypothetical protein
MRLVTTSNLASPDDAYQALIDAHRPLSEAESHAFNARLVLLLANHIGSLDVLREALAAAGEAGRDGHAAHAPHEQSPTSTGGPR